MPVRDKPRKQGAANRDRELEELLSEAVQHLKVQGKQFLRVEPPAAKKPSAV